MSPPRVVLDSNVLVSALLFSTGSLGWLRVAWQTGRFVPLASRTTMAELLTVLHYPKFRLDDREREDLLLDYLPWCETIHPAPTPPVPDCRDPFDRPFLELALGAGAVALVTGDKDLLALAGSVPVPILKPAEFRLSLPE